MGIAEPQKKMNYFFFPDHKQNPRLLFSAKHDTGLNIKTPNLFDSLLFLFVFLTAQSNQVASSPQQGASACLGVSR